MSVVDAYDSLPGRFDLWVRVMEMGTRTRQLNEASLGEAKALVISPPTDPGIRMIGRANEGGETTFLCWSKPVLEMGTIAMMRDRLSNLKVLEADPLNVPSVDGTLDVVFANCLFDFCEPAEIEEILKEIGRVLRPEGRLFAVYMGEPEGALERLWCGLFEQMQSISRGCHPVDIVPSLRNHGFKDIHELRLSRFGFPLRFVRTSAPGP